MAANRAGSIAAGLTAFVVLAVGFLVASGLWIAYRVHWESTRWAAFVEDTATPVRVTVRMTGGLFAVAAQLCARVAGHGAVHVAILLQTTPSSCTASRHVRPTGVSNCPRSVQLRNSMNPVRG